MLNSRIRILGGRNATDDNDMYFFNSKGATTSPTIIKHLPMSSRSGTSGEDGSVAIEMRHATDSGSNIQLDLKEDKLSG